MAGHPGGSLRAEVVVLRYRRYGETLRGAHQVRPEAPHERARPRRRSRPASTQESKVAGRVRLSAPATSTDGPLFEYGGWTRPQ
jgi:hypothetical protein